MIARDPWAVSREVDYAHSMSKRCGFELRPAYPERPIGLFALRAPYAKDVRIGTFNSWREVILFFQGYEQRILEADIGTPK